MVTSEAEVKRKASGVGRVEGKPKLARTRIASSQVDAPADDKNKMEDLHKTAEPPPFCNSSISNILKTPNILL